MRLDKSNEAQTYGITMNVSLLAEFDPAPIFVEGLGIEIWGEGDDYRRFYFKQFIKNWCGVQFADGLTAYDLRRLHSVSRLLIEDEIR